MSALPSALKSPAVIARQFIPGLLGGEPPWSRLKPFISQIAMRPSLTFWNAMSDLPSLLKSAVANGRPSERGTLEIARRTTALQSQCYSRVQAVSRTRSYNAGYGTRGNPLAPHVPALFEALLRGCHGCLHPLDQFVPQ